MNISENMITCPVCDGVHLFKSDLLVEQSIHLYHCEECQLSFLGLSKDDTRNESFDDYWVGPNRELYQKPEVYDELKNKYSKYFSTVVNKAPNKRLLDVGSGIGIAVEIASTYGFKSMGLEPSTSAVEVAKKRSDTPFFCGLLSSDCAIGKGFGVLTLWDVIEHVPDPEEMLRTCATRLAPNGILILETPDERALLRSFIRLLGPLMGKHDLRSSIYYRAHRYYFSRKAISILLLKCGFEKPRFYAERTMFKKEILKKRMFDNIPYYKEVMLRVIFFLVKLLPFTENKMVVVARKKTDL